MKDDASLSLQAVGLGAGAQPVVGTHAPPAARLGRRASAPLLTAAHEQLRPPSSCSTEQRPAPELPRASPPETLPVRRRHSVGALPSASPPKAPSSKSKTGSSELDELQETVDRARRNGVDDAKVKQLERLLVQEKASEGLNAAIANGDSKAVREAVSRAQFAGVSKQVLQEARKHMMQLEAMEMLTAAAEAADVDRLQQAIYKAKSAGFSQREIDQAEQLRTSIEAQETINAAMATRNLAAVEYAIKEAKGNGASRKVIERAERQLEQWSTSKELSGVLGNAVLGDRERIREVLQKAEEVGVKDGEVARARKKLKQLDAAFQLQAALRCGGMPSLQQALEAARANAVDPMEVEKGERILAERAKEAELAQQLEQMTYHSRRRASVGGGVSQDRPDMGADSISPQRGPRGRRASIG